MDRSAFWPEGLDPRDNVAVSEWLAAGGWRHYALLEVESPVQPGSKAWRAKRVLNIGITLFILPLALLLVAAAALAILLTMGRPVFFRQQRPGYLCRPFTMWKLRTMRIDGNSESPRQDAQRLTRLGRFLRRTSIDELPQLWNVLRGEMSLVGPRPQLMAYLPRMSGDDLRRQLVLPGITGASQIAGRNDVAWEDRFAMDLDYVAAPRVMRDVWILARTVPMVLTAKGVESGRGAATMEEMPGAPSREREEVHS